MTGGSVLGGNAGSALNGNQQDRALMFDELADIVDLQVARQDLPSWEKKTRN
jgi:hypothetical protein